METQNKMNLPLEFTLNTQTQILQKMSYSIQN